jgi:alpha,alpha-trehalose phosphorylase
VSPAGKRIRVSSTRLMSFTQRSVAAICYEVDALDGAARFAVQSELVANEQLPASASADPRVAAVLDSGSATRSAWCTARGIRGAPVCLPATAACSTL